jgi:phage tail-like protein
MASYADHWPIAKYHFKVSLGGAELSFQEAQGLETSTDVIEYRHGDSLDFHKIKQAGLVKVSNLTLKKGVFQGGSELIDIFNHLQNDKGYYSIKGNRIDIDVYLLDEQGSPVMHWNIHNAFPIKYSGTDLKSTANEVAIESIEFAYEKITYSL